MNFQTVDQILHDKDLSSRFHRVADIDIPSIMFEPISTGIKELDANYSELHGMIPSQVTLFTGVAGGGKTTLMNKKLATMAANNPDRAVVLISQEMSEFQLKLQARKIPNFDKLLIVTGPVDVDQWIEDLKRIRPLTVVLDSIQACAHKTPGSFTKNQVAIVTAFKEFAKETFTPVDLIGHVGKNGDYIGPTAIKHMVDSHMHLEYDKETQERYFFFDKNRFGGAYEKVPFRIDHTGVYVGSEYYDTLERQLHEEEEKLENEVQEKEIQETDADALRLDVMKAVRAFKADRDGAFINAERFRLVAPMLLSLLVQDNLQRIATEAFVPAARIHIKFDGSDRCDCHFREGTIRIGSRFIRNIKDESRSIYKKEWPYIGRWVKNREEWMLWAVLHEFMHLFRGMDRHNNTFFRSVELLAARYSWIFD